VGSWIEDQQTLQQKFPDDYINGFKSIVPNTREIPNLGLPQIVTKEDNLLLVQPITLQELKTAVWGIDPHKTPGSDGLAPVSFRNTG